MQGVRFNWIMTVNSDLQACSFSGPLFLVGMPRSGTKLLRDLLNQHSHIAIPQIETEFLPGLINRYSSEKSYSRDEFRTLFAELIRFPYFTYLSASGFRFTADEWYDACVEPNLAGIFEALVRCSTGTVNQRKVIWGDKSPSYINHIPLLKKVYPAAKFIHIVRDVRDYAISISKAWGKNRLRATQRWADSLDAIERDLKAIEGDALVVRYEDLLDEHDPILRRILDFLGLDFEERVLELCSAPENLGDTRGETRIVSGNKNKYKVMLRAEEIRSLEELAGETLRRYGYESSYQGPRKRLSRSRQNYYQLLDAINMVKFEKNDRGYIGAVLFYWSYFKATRGL